MVAGKYYHRASFTVIFGIALIVIKRGERKKMETIGTRRLCKILQVINLKTLILYLNNYRFCKFRTTYTTGAQARYLLNSEFLKTLYTLLLIKNRDTEAANLKDTFKIYKIRAIKWEDFVCES